MRTYLTQPSQGGPYKRLGVGAALLCLSLASNSMDLLQAYEAASLHDATILAARSAAIADREELPQAKAQMLPNVNISASHNDNRLTSTTPNFLGTEQTTQNHYPSENQTLMVRQALYRPQLTAQYRQAKAQVDDAEAALVQEEQNLAVRVSNAYFDALLTNDQLALVLAQQATFKTQLDIAKKTFAAGSGTRTDIDEAQARLDMNMAVEIEARQNVTYSMQQLQTLTNQPVDKLATLNIAEMTLLPPQPNTLEEWIARAEQNSPQQKTLRARVEIARQEAKKATAGHHPTLDAVAQWSNAESESVTNTSSRYTNKSIGLQLNIPIFAGGYVNSLVRQSLARQERAEQLLEAGRRDLALRIHKEFRNVTESVPKIKALEQALRSSDQLVLSSRKSFQAGSRTVIDILNAEQQRVLVLRDLSQARFMYLLSRIKLLALTGEADLQALTSVNKLLQH
jgi:protease secretion system outer membrane protein